MIQLRTGPNVLRSAYLVAPDSPRGAFYTIWVECNGEQYRVCKASGAHARVWHRQLWDCQSLEDAEKLFQRRLRDKTNPHRKTRRYVLVLSLP